MQPYMFWCVTCLTQYEISLLKMIKPRVEHSKLLLKQLHCTNSVSALWREIVVCCKAVLNTAILQGCVDKRWWWKTNSLCCHYSVCFRHSVWHNLEVNRQCVNHFQVIEFCVICEDFMTNSVFIFHPRCVWVCACVYRKTFSYPWSFSLDEAYTWCLQNEQYRAQHCPWGTQSPGTSVPSSFSNEKNDLKCRRKPSNH